MVVISVAEFDAVVELHSWSAYFSRSDVDFSRSTSCLSNNVFALVTKVLITSLVVVPMALRVARMLLMLPIAVE